MSGARPPPAPVAGSTEHLSEVALALQARVSAAGSEAASIASELGQLAAAMGATAAGPGTAIVQAAGAAHADDGSGGQHRRASGPCGPVAAMLPLADELHIALTGAARAAGDAPTLQLPLAEAASGRTLRPSAGKGGSLAHSGVEVGTGGGAAELLPQLRCWGFPIFRFSAALPGRVLRATAWACLGDLELPSKLGVDGDQLAAWLGAVEEHYHTNPYHNATHVADVTQTTHYILTTGSLSTWLTPLQQYALLLAAVAHDVGHPGVNNGYLVNTAHPLAVTYNDSSPLENMHAALAFALAAVPGHNPLAGLSAEDAKAVRADVIHCILGTDNATHFGNLASLKEALAAAESDEEGHLIGAQPRLVMQQ
ncbi:dnc, partial [Symbiodinium sp. KB8]